MSHLLGQSLRFRVGEVTSNNRVFGKLLFTHSFL